MILDSLAALILTAAAIAAWRMTGRVRRSGIRSDARMHLRFGATLFAALAFATMLGWAVAPALAGAVAAIVTPLASVALALSLFTVLARPVPQAAAALGLMLALGAGLAAALADAPVYALICQIAALALTAAAALGAMVAGAPRALPALLALLSLLCGGLMVMDDALGGALLFFAAGLIAACRALQPRVEAEREDNRLGAVSRR